MTPAPPQDASAIVKSPTASPAKAQRIGKRARRLTLHAETDVIIDIGRSTSPVPAGATGASSVADSVHGRGSPTPRLTPRDAAPAAAAGAPPPSSPPSAAAATGTATIAAVDVPAPTSEAAVPADDGAQWHDTVAAAAARGIADVIGLLDRHVASEPACVAWCCDAITGLCSGNGASGSHLFGTRSASLSVLHTLSELSAHSLPAPRVMRAPCPHLRPRRAQRGTAT